MCHHNIFQLNWSASLAKLLFAQICGVNFYVLSLAMPPRKNKPKEAAKAKVPKGKGPVESAAGTKVGPQVKVAKGELPDSILDLNAPSTSAPPTTAASNKVGELS